MNHMTIDKKPSPRRANRCLLNAYALGSSRVANDHRQRSGQLLINASRGNTGAGNRAQRSRRAAGFASMKSSNSPSSHMSLGYFGW